PRDGLRARCRRSRDHDGSGDDRRGRATLGDIPGTQERENSKIRANTAQWREGYMRGQPHARWLGFVIGLLIAFPLAMPAMAQITPANSKLTKITKSGEIAICIWPEYYGISYKDPKTGQLEGIDIELAKEFAKELKAKITWVETTFATFIADLQTNKCDIGMFGLAAS